MKPNQKGKVTVKIHKHCIMKSILIIKRFVVLLIFTGCVFILQQCSKNEFFDDDGTNIEAIIPIAPLFDYSSIVFMGSITENSADRVLCIMDTSGNNVRKISNMTLGCGIKPLRSLCGTRFLVQNVIFESSLADDNSVKVTYQYELYIVDIDGTKLAQIDQTDHTVNGYFGGFDWAPDDKHIIYVKGSHDKWDKNDLILYNILDKTHTILQTVGKVCTPKFSPDGKQIAYCTTVEDSHHIYKIDVVGENGKNNHLLISNAASPKWSPQGDKIAYSSSGKERSSQIFVANEDGRNQKQLTSTISPIRYPGWSPDGNNDPQWTPDGKKIVYVSWENGKPEIYIMNADGSKQTRLTVAEFRDEYPEVTPDGKHILFSSRRSSMMDYGIIVMTLEGKNQRVLTKSGICPIASK